MKTSKYNLMLPDKDRHSLIYNTFSGAIIRGNSALISALKRNDISGIRKNDLEDKLAEFGFLVSDNFDELEAYRKIHERWKSGKELCEFNILLTYDCNFACPYCYQGRGEEGQKIHGFKSMSPEMINIFKSFVKRTVGERNSKRMELVLYGGEPFLMPNECKEVTNDLADWAKSDGIEFKLNALSNGSLITPEIVEWAHHYKMRLQIPVDGDPDMHNKIRFYKDTGKGSFDDITNVLAMTKGTDIETHIRISLTDETYPTMEHMLDVLAERGLTHIYPDFCYITAFTSACADYQEHVIPDTKLFKVMPKLWREAHKRGFPLDHVKPHPQTLPCSSIADGSYIVDPFGDVYKCWELVGLKEHVVGTLNHDGSMKKTAVYGDTIERDPTQIPQCRDHLYLPSCAGGCICKAYWQEGTYHAPGCGTENFLLPDKVRMYVETLNLKEKPIFNGKDMELQIIEGKQEPAMSHCYVLV